MNLHIRCTWMSNVQRVKPTFLNAKHEISFGVYTPFFAHSFLRVSIKLLTLLSVSLYLSSSFSCLNPLIYFVNTLSSIFSFRTL